MQTHKPLKADDIIDIMTEYPDNYILAETADATAGDIMRDLIVLKDSDGSDAEVSDADGRLYSPEISREAFEELLRSGRIQPKESREYAHQSHYVLAAQARSQGEAA